MQNIIEIRHLNKSYGNVKAVSDLSFDVRKGEIFAFLGVNGAGKSTTISIISGQLSKDSGSVKVCGRDADESFAQIQSRIGVVFQGSVLDQALSVTDNLTSRAALYGIKGKACRQRIDEMAELLDFRDILDRTVGKLSGGQRRRIDIARALMHSPEILILDEPTTGLDPQTRKLLWQTVRELRESKQMTVFMTTHYMEEAADADHIVIIDGGRIAAQGSPLELKNKYTGDYIMLYGVDEAQIKTLGYPYTVIKDAVMLSVPDTSTATELILKKPELFTDFEVMKGKMDDVFLAVTGKSIRGE